jgi:oligoendopeptidase F
LEGKHEMGHGMNSYFEKNEKEFKERLMKCNLTPKSTNNYSME